MWETLWLWSKSNLTKGKQSLIAENFIKHVGIPKSKNLQPFQNTIEVIKQFLELLRDHPLLGVRYVLWKTIIKEIIK